MARRRFFVPQIRRGVAELTGLEAEHLVRVLRAEAGQVYEISDNQDVYLAEIESARKSLVSFRCIEKLAPEPAGVSVTLVAAIFKFDRFEWLVEKATELGVAVIQPVEARRTERGLFEASRKRSARWEKIALEASQQARRDKLPAILPAVDFEKAIAVPYSVKCLLDEEPDATPILKATPGERHLDDSVALLLGPEGGWTETERRQAIDSGWVACGLGPHVLRAETAGIAALAVIQAAWEQSRARTG